MNIPPHPLLQYADSSEPKTGGEAEQLVSPPPVDSDVKSPPESVGASGSGVARLHVVLDATIPASDAKWESALSTQGIKSAYRAGDNLVFTTTTAAGELIKFEVNPAHIVLVRLS